MLTGVQLFLVYAVFFIYRGQLVYGLLHLPGCSDGVQLFPVYRGATLKHANDRFATLGARKWFMNYYFVMLAALLGVWLVDLELG